MTTQNRWATSLAGMATAWALVACGGGGGSNDSGAVAVTPQPSTPVIVAPPETGAPASEGNIAIDGRNWINFRRAQAGVATLTQNALIDSAAQAHSDYQKLQPLKSGQPADPTHNEVAGNPGFTGATLKERLNHAGYTIPTSGFAYGEVISAMGGNSGFAMAEELITAIYHRFVIFEPQFKEIGSGSGTTGQNYTYFTTDFGARNGYGPGLGTGKFIVWPYNGQTGVTPNFFSDSESPDPVPEKDANGKSIDEVGYPISVHGDFDAVVKVQSFTVQPRGGNPLTAKVLQHSTDPETEDSAAAIVPMAPLRNATTYDVSFSGTVDGMAVTKSWSFTTR